MNNDSVIFSSIGPRIGYYASASGVNNGAIKNYIKRQCELLEQNITQPQLVNVTRVLQGFRLAMGDEKRTTEMMYLDGDIEKLINMQNRLFPTDKNKGRNFVNTMKQNPIILDNSQENEADSNTTQNLKGKTLTKIDSSSNAYKFYSNNVG